ncbi:MAG: aminotransferase class I/II-fold pyridoxal phosphate-dependent enzyme [Actinobacteria bacterium]|nr:aminotransferase class I/II-fold pyridoxal phosphate-dependent enzyme [Actinomycetota bacterium]
MNINPLGMPQTVKDAIISHIDEYESYPDTECRALRTAIAVHEAVDPADVLCGNGAADLIYRICASKHPKRTLVLAPTFSEYERAALLCGSEIVYHELSEAEGFALTERILGEITPDIDMVFLCNPNNPTGKLTDVSLLRGVARRCEETGALLVVDECFLPFTSGESLVPLIKENQNIVILKAFTKIYSMAGLRLGYMLSGNHEILQAAEQSAQCWSVSSVAQVAGLAALSCEGLGQRTQEFVKKERDYMVLELQARNLSVFDSDANFLLIKSEVPLYEPLLRKGILVRRCANFGGLDERYFRVGIKLHPQNAALVQAIEEVLNG